MERFTEGRDEDAFGELVCRHGPMVMSACRRRLSCEQDCQDAFQATFLTLVTKARWIRQRSSVAGWLQRVAVRISIDLQRGNRRRRTVTDTAEAYDSPINHETTLVIEEELARLPANYRNAIVLCHLEGYTNAEAARILAVPRTTLSSWLTKAREQLRGRLVRQGVKLSIGAITSGLVGLRGASTTVEAGVIQSTSRAATLHAAGKPIACTAAASIAKATISKMILGKMTTSVLVGLTMFGGFRFVQQAKAETISIVIPQGLESVEGNLDVTPESLAAIFPSGSRIQQLVSKELFADLGDKPHYITGLRYRADGQLSEPRNIGHPNYELRLSTTSLMPGELSSRFENNRGDDETVVFAGPWNFVTENEGPSNGPKKFDAILDFDEPFLYDPSRGNLLLDDFTFGRVLQWGHDLHQPEDTSSYQWIAGSLNDQVAGFGDDWVPVTEFVFEPVPEPSAASLLGFAAFGLAWMRLRDA